MPIENSNQKNAITKTNNHVPICPSRKTCFATCTNKPLLKTKQAKENDQISHAPTHPLHCVKNSFFFLTIVSKHICTTPFDCFDLEW